MKTSLFASAFAVLALSACETTMPPTDTMVVASTEITTLAQFNELIVGKRLRHAESNFVIIQSDGSMTGEFGGNTLEGTWQWEGKYMCRTLTTIRPGTDCQAWSVDGNEITIVRDRGTGDAATYFFR